MNWQLIVSYVPASSFRDKFNAVTWPLSFTCTPFHRQSGLSVPHCWLRFHARPFVILNKSIKISRSLREGEAAESFVSFWSLLWLLLELSILRFFPVQRVLGKEKKWTYDGHRKYPDTCARHLNMWVIERKDLRGWRDEEMKKKEWKRE